MLSQAYSANDNAYFSMLSSGTIGLIWNVELKEEIFNKNAYVLVNKNDNVGFNLFVRDMFY
jgi:hypothetical protein